jgi:chaperonin GroEL (HSP60 family)
MTAIRHTSADKCALPGAGSSEIAVASVLRSLSTSASHSNSTLSPSQPSAYTPSFQNTSPASLSPALSISPHELPSTLPTPPPALSRIFNAFAEAIECVPLAVAINAGHERYAVLNLIEQLEYVVFSKWYMVY